MCEHNLQNVSSYSVNTPYISDVNDRARFRLNEALFGKNVGPLYCSCWDGRPSAWVSQCTKTPRRPENVVLHHVNSKTSQNAIKGPHTLTIRPAV